MEEKLKRTDDGINVLKFIAIVLVILIHETLPGELGLAAKGIAAMAVPVFFMVSGYYSYGASIPKIRKRTIKIFALTILVNAIYFIWDVAVEFFSGASVPDWLRQNCSLKRFLVLLLTNESPFRGHLWFLGALTYSYLFLLVLLMYIERGRGRFARIIKENLIKFMFSLSVLLLILNLAGGEFLTFYGKNIQIPYIRNWLFMGIPFFSLAYCIHAYEEHIYSRFSTGKICLILTVLLFINIAEVWFMPQSGLYITTIFVNITAFILALRFSAISSPILVRLGNLADKYGLWVYALQIMVIKSLRRLYGQWGIADKAVILYLSPFIALVISFIISIIPVWISSVIKKK
ncbi:MAG: acyltransferase [Lachnospiraceae bacterium]|nr:acyltransferase [Lachnospiraceae bacterium]